MAATFILSRIKSAIVPAGKSPRTIPLGLFRGMRMDMDLGRDLQFYLGLNEIELAPWVRRFSSGIKSAIDVGCCEGYYTIYFKKNTNARVIAIDCDPSAERLLNRSLKLNGADVEFSLIELSEKHPLDSFLPISVPAVVKMDIEGWEAVVLKTAPRLLQQDVRWIVETHSKPVEDECLAIFSAAGLVTRIVPNAWWRAVLPERRIGHNRWIVAARSI